VDQSLKHHAQLYSGPTVHPLGGEDATHDINIIHVGVSQMTRLLKCKCLITLFLTDSIKVFQFSDDNAIYLSNIYIDKRSNFSAFSTRNILARLQIH